MPATPASAARRSGRGSRLDVPDDLQPFVHDKTLVVPRYVFPKEKVPDGFSGWEGRITGVDRVRDDGLHVFVTFEGYYEQYHFSVDEVRRWIGGATSPAKRRPAAAAGEAEEPAAPASARRSARKAPGGSRTPATAARRRSAAAAKLRAVAEGEEEEEEEVAQRQQEEPQRAEQEASQGEEEAAAEEGGRAQEAAAPAEGHQGAASPRLRKRKASAVGASEEEGGPHKRQEGEDGTAVEQQEVEEPGWVDKAAEVVRQAVFSTTALGVCYGLLRTLYPDVA